MQTLTVRPCPCPRSCRSSCRCPFSQRVRSRGLGDCAEWLCNTKISLYPLLVGSQREPNEEIPDFGSQREPKVRGSHSFGSRREPKTGDLTSGSQRKLREWGWLPFSVHDVSPRRSNPCLLLFTTWAKRRQDNQEHNGYVAEFTKQKAVHHHHIRVKLHHSRVGRRRVTSPTTFNGKLSEPVHWFKNSCA